MGRRRFGREFKIESVRLIKERGAKAQPIGRPHRGLQDGAHFRLRAAVVLRRAELQGAVRHFGEVPDGNDCHDFAARHSIGSRSGC